MTKTNKYGTTAYNIINYANKIGFLSKCYLVDDITKVKTPFIAHLFIDNKYYHYVVVFEIKDDILTIGDPKDGIKKMKMADFAKIWTKIVITFLPNNKIPYIEEQKISPFLKEIISKYKFLYIKIFILSLLTFVLGVMLSFMLEILYQNALINGNNYKLQLTFFVIILCMIFLNFYKNNLILKFSNKIDSYLNNKVFKHLMLLPYSYYNNNITGDIINRINDINLIKEFIINIFIELLIMIITSLIAFVIMIYINSLLSFLSLIVLFLNIMITLIFLKRNINNISKFKEDAGILNHYMIERIKGFETIYNLNLKENSINNFSHKLNVYLNNYQKIIKTFNYEIYYKDLIIYLANLLIIILGINNKMEITRLMSFIFINSYFLEPLKNLNIILNNIYNGHSALKRIMEILSYKVLEDNSLALRGIIEFKNLTFGYNHENIFQDYNLKLIPMVNTMILGKSGRGKSTLFKLLIKQYLTDKIYINNKSIVNYSYKNILHYINYISQNEVIFTGTILENITFDKKITDFELNKVLETVNLKEIYEKYNKPNYILENNVHLSGGEKKKIYLARALLKEGEFIILDETLSSVSVYEERQILEKIIKNYPHKTLIYITHRVKNKDLFQKIITV